MTAGLKPYPDNKGSDLPWLGQIPEHWKVSQARHIGRFLKGIGGTKEDAVLEGVPCVRYGELYTTFTYFIRNSKSFIRNERAQSYTPILYGDVLFAGSGETIEEIGKSAVNLMRDRAVCGGDVVILRPNIPVHAPFLGYAMDSRPATSQKATMGRGTTVKHIYPDELKRLLIPLPPLDEQEAIVRYLDWANGLLERAIRVKRKEIALLNEQKQVVIHQAITQDLDPLVPLKPSGIPWIGDIPQHWKVLALKRALKQLIDCEHKTAPMVDKSDYRVVRTSAVRDGTLHIRGTYCTDYYSFQEWTKRGMPEHGDVIFTREAPAGEACMVPQGMSLCLGQRTVLMKPQEDLLIPQFLVHMIYVGPPHTLILQASRGSTVGHFNVSDIASMAILLPPKSEQEGMVQSIESETKNIISAVTALKREIELLREYHTRLVADVVTGKLDVRDATAHLPIETVEPTNTSLEDEELSSDTEIEDEEARI